MIFSGPSGLHSSGGISGNCCHWFNKLQWRKDEIRQAWDYMRECRGGVFFKPCVFTAGDHEANRRANSRNSQELNEDTECEWGGVISP